MSCRQIRAHLTKGRTIGASLIRGQTITGTLDKATVTPPVYSGAYEVTPSRTAQTIPTAGLMMSGDLKVNPIPSNYGLITWNGSTLMVS